MIGLNSQPSYHPWNRSYDIEAFKSAATTRWGNGLYRLRNFEDEADWVWKMRTITLFYFAMEIRGSI